MSIYCYRCGQRLASGTRHCPSCGASIFYDENGLRDENARQAEGAGQGEQAGFGSQHTFNQDSFKQDSFRQDTFRQENPYGQNAWQQAGNPAVEKAESHAKISMILGIVSGVMCLFMPYIGLLLAIAALVLGILGLKAQVNRGRAVAGLVMGIIFLILNGLVVALAIYYLANPSLLNELMEKWNLSGW